MKRITLILWLLLSTAIWTFASNFKVGDLYYNITSGSTVEVTYQKISSSDNYAGLASVIIPSTVTYGSITYTVTTIGSHAFDRCSGLTSVTIPNSVTSIGDDAFYHCYGLTSVTIPNSVTNIGSNAFDYCTNLTSITIPSSVTRIGGYAFRNTPWYQDRPNGVVYINNVLYACKGVMPDNTSIAVKEGTVSISPYAFNGCTKPISVTIPNSITSIGKYAFSGCTGLTSVTIPNSVKGIGSCAFKGCTSLTSITLPNSVKSIDVNAFSGCTSLTSITIPDSVTYSGGYAFSGCTSLTSVVWNAKSCKNSESFSAIASQITSFTFGDGVEYIPASLCFGMKSLTSITIPNSVTSIGSSAFGGCSGLTSVTIGKSVTSIGYDAFNGCTRLAAVVWNAKSCEDFDYYYRPFSATDPQITSFTFGDEVEYIPARLCLGMKSLTSVTIPNSITSIGKYAFYNCTGLTSVTIGNSVTYIGDYAFTGCTGLTSVTIPNSVKGIGDVAFKGCSGLTSVTIPNSVTSIGGAAFSDCTGLTSVIWNAKSCEDFSSSYAPFSATDSLITSFTFGDEVEHIPACLCYGMTGLTSVSIPDSVTSIGYCAFYGCSSLTSVTIGNSVTSIGTSAFNGCSGLTSITIPNSITSIGDGAFSGCTGLTSVVWNVKSYEDFSSSSYAPFSAAGSQNTSFTFGDEVEYIPGCLCYGMTGLTSVTIGNSVTSIGKNAFDGCTGLTSVVWNAKSCEDFDDDYRPFSDTDSLITSFTFGDEVEYIPGCLCYGMKSLSSVTIPNSVKSIGERAFLGCTGLTSVTIGNSVTSIGWSAFSGCTGLTSVTIGNSVTSIGWSAFSGCSGLTSITIPNSITSIGESIFSGCTGLTSVSLPDSVTSIGKSAFNGCSGLASITIPDSVTSIGQYAFGDCSGLTSVTIGNSVTSIGSSAFNGCTGLTSVVWNAKSCKDFSRGSYAPFYDSRSLITSFTFGDEVEYIPANLCYEMTGLTSITIPDSVTSIGQYAFSGCTGLTSVVWNAKSYEDFGYYSSVPFYDSRSQITSFTLGDDVEHIPAYLCYGMTGLTSITIPDSVTSIGRYAFSDCSGLTSVTIGNSVTSIGDYAFDGCSGLTSVTIPNSVTSVGKSTFSSCSGLTSVVWNAKSCKDFGDRYDAPFYYSNSQINSFTFGDEVEHLPAYLCYGRTNLTSITIPNSVTSIGNNAFGYDAYSGCTGLTSVTMLSETPPTIQYNALGFNSSLPIYVPCGATQAYREAWSQYNTFIEPAPQYSFMALPESGEMGEIYFEQTYSCSNDTVIMYAYPSIGYYFTQWNDGNTDNPRTVKVTSDTIFIAHYSTEQYTIYTEVNDAERGSVSQPVTADYLSYVTIYATANHGYHFTQWNDGNTDNPRIVQVEGRATYTAYFERNTYSVTVLSANELQGTATANATQAEYQDTVTLTATPSIGYRFTKWNDGNTDNPRQIVLACDTTITAEFALAYSGQCGDNLYWAYAGHTLTISGTGAMYDYNADNMPWILLRDTINAVILERGITHIGNNAFNGLAKLNKIELPNTLTSIGTGAFAGCRKLYDIYSYAIEPPVADNSSFSNYNVYLLVPCDNLRDYQMDAVFGSFKYIQCLGAESTTTDGDVTVTPSDNEAVFVWPSDASAATYTLEIRKDGDVFCTLHFNAAGHLTSIAFAPSRNGTPHRAAEQTGAGFRFTVTGLSQSTRYQFDMTVKDAADTTLQTYTGEFNTTGVATSVGQAEDTQSATVQKVLRNGQVYILRGDKTYTVTGQEVND